MRTVLLFLLCVSLAGVLAILGAGFVTVARGGNPKRSNKLMQARVIMQALALFFLAMLMLLGRG